MDHFRARSGCVGGSVGGSAWAVPCYRICVTNHCLGCIGSGPMSYCAQLSDPRHEPLPVAVLEAEQAGLARPFAPGARAAILVVLLAELVAERDLAAPAHVTCAVLFAEHGRAHLRDRKAADLAFERFSQQGARYRLRRCAVHAAGLRHVADALELAQEP